MIAKVAKNSGFTIIPSEILRDCSLSLGARMFYALAQSCSSQWNINIKHFASLMNVSEASVRKYRNELVNAGILQYEQMRDENGKLTQNTLYTFKSLEVQDIKEQISPQELAQNEPNAQECKIEPFEQKTAYGDSSDISNINILNKNNSNLMREQNLPQNHLKNAPKQNTSLLFIVQKSLKQFHDSTKQRSTNYKQALNQNAYTPQEHQAFKDFIAYRKERGFLAKSTIASIVRDFEKLKTQGADISACVEVCINRGWSGLLKAYEALLRYESYKTHTSPKNVAQIPQNSTQNALNRLQL